jgi:hypothetical protein
MLKDYNKRRGLANSNRTDSLLWIKLSDLIISQLQILPITQDLWENTKLLQYLLFLPLTEVSLAFPFSFVSLFYQLHNVQSKNFTKQRSYNFARK